MNARIPALALTAVATLALSACTSSSKDSSPSALGTPSIPVASPEVAITDPAAVLTVEDQTSEGPTVNVKAVALTKPGFVVVAGDGGRNILGTGNVDAGAAPQMIQVSLAEEPTEKIELIARLYTDSDGDGFFSAGDEPVTNGKNDDSGSSFAGLEQIFDFTGAKVINN